MGTSARHILSVYRQKEVGRNSDVRAGFSQVNFSVLLGLNVVLFFLEKRLLCTDNREFG